MGKKVEWRDSSSYSQGERGQVEPRTWELRLDGLCICVTRRIHLEGWWLTCHDLRIGGGHPVPLSSTMIADAQKEALCYVRRQLVERLERIVEVAYLY